MFPVVGLGFRDRPWADLGRNIKVDGPKDEANLPGLRARADWDRFSVRLDKL